VKCFISMIMRICCLLNSAARRPKPPSLKAEALALLEPQGSPARLLNEDQMGIIRRALEQLDD
jgi:hypothetical protein